MGSGGEVVEETVNPTSPKRAKKLAFYACACIARSRLNISSRAAQECEIHRRVGPHQGTRRQRRTMYLDIVNALMEGKRSDINVIGGRYGLSSKEFTPAMTKAVFDELAKPEPKNHFTLGINDDVSTPA
jgi:pyruvate-ferredoxin/flavodoxin oxidoreductase